MKNKQNSGYIHIIGQKKYLKNKEIKSLVINILTTKKNGLVCTFGKNKSQKTDFLYGRKYGDEYKNMLIEVDEFYSNNYEKSLFEIFTEQLFFQANKIKTYFESKKKKAYFFKIKCSFLLIKCENINTYSDNIYDVFQGLRNSLEIVGDNDTNNFNVLQIDIQEPIQLLNMLKIARKLQFEQAMEENIKFHSLFVFDIESALYKIGFENCGSTTHVFKCCNKMYILDFAYEDNGSELLYCEDINSKKFTKELLFFFFKSLSPHKSEGHLLLLNIIYKCIFDASFASILFFQHDNLDIKINKYKNYFRNSEKLSEFSHKYSIEYSSNDENTLFSTFKKMIDCLFCLKKLYLKMGNSYIINLFNSQESELIRIFEDLIILFYNLNGHILNYEDILNYINEIENLIFLKTEMEECSKNNSIEYKTICEYIENYYLEYSNFNPNFQQFQDICLEGEQKKENFDFHLSKDDADAESEVSQVETSSNEAPKNANNQYDIEFYSENFLDKLNNSVIGIKDEFVDIFSKKQNKFYFKNTRRTKSCTDLSFNKLLKDNSISSFSKILIAVNTARRRVREYRKKQQTKIDNSSKEKSNNYQVHSENKYEKHIFWNKTLLKCPIFSYEKNCSKTKIDPDIFLPKQSNIRLESEEIKKNSIIKETKEVEIQVNIQEANDRSNKKIDVNCVQVDIKGTEITEAKNKNNKVITSECEIKNLEENKYNSDFSKNKHISSIQTRPNITYIDNSIRKNLNSHFHCNSNINFQRWLAYQRISHQTFFSEGRIPHPIYNNNVKYLNNINLFKVN